MIGFADFAPGIKQAGGFLRTTTYESFEAAVEAANAWLAEQSNVRLVNIETVVLPNLWAPGEEGTADAELSTAEGQYGSNQWYQFVRVWFEYEETAAQTG